MQLDAIERSILFCAAQNKERGYLIPRCRILKAQNLARHTPPLLNIEQRGSLNFARITERGEALLNRKGCV